VARLAVTHIFKSRAPFPLARGVPRRRQRRTFAAQLARGKFLDLRAIQPHVFLDAAHGIHARLQPNYRDMPKNGRNLDTSDLSTNALLSATLYQLSPMTAKPRHCAGRQAVQRTEDGGQRTVDYRRFAPQYDYLRSSVLCPLDCRVAALLAMTEFSPPYRGEYLCC
jgi:hypothetical protein